MSNAKNEYQDLLFPDEDLNLGPDSLPERSATDKIFDPYSLGNEDIKKKIKEVNVWAGTTPSFTTEISVPNAHDYEDRIGRPFSWTNDNIDDMRAHSQSFGEKAAYALPKFITRVGTNVLGSTVGLIYGGGEFITGLIGGEGWKGASNSFFDNDFQRGLDGVNEWMDGALPHYYTDEEISILRVIH